MFHYPVSALPKLAWLLAALPLLPLHSPAELLVERVDDFNPGGRGSGPYAMISFQGNLYFQANDPVAGRELLRFDGTAVSVAADIRPSGDSSPQELTVSGGLLFFTADDGQHGRRLWSFNGTTARLIDTTQYVATAQELVSFDGDLYFRGVRFGDVGIELFRYDGNAITAFDIYPGTGSSYPQHFAVYAGALYFSAGGAPGQGSELWRHDGLALSKAGANIRNGSGSAPAWLTPHAGQLYFSANDGVHGNELWRFDGTTSALAADIVPGGEYGSSDPSSLASYAGALYFNANGGGGDGYELWRFDGTSSAQVANINPNPPGPGGDDFLADSNPSDLTVFEGKLFFLADDGVHGRELWVYDGTSTSMVADIRSLDQYGSNPSELRVVEGVLYLIADSGEGFGLELYRVVSTPPTGIVNGDFESGTLSPWVLTGAGALVPGSVFNPAIAPPGGQSMGYITTLNNEGAEDFGYFNDSPDLDGDGNRESEFSSLSITFTTAETCVVSFDLNFLTDEVFPGIPASTGDSDIFGVSTGDIRSGPYLVLAAIAPSDGSYTGSARQLHPGDFTDGLIEESNFGVFPTLPDASRFRGQTGFGNYWFEVEPGTHTWTFFVADSHTDGVASALLIDNLRVAPRTAMLATTANFGTVTLPPAFEINGTGTNVDSIAFWEAPDPAETRMFVTGKNNDVVEVWKFPFVGNELPALSFPANVNGVAVDQETDRLYVSDRIVSVFSVPDLQAQGNFGSGILGVGENNLDLLKHSSGATWIYVSDDHNVHRFDAANSQHLGSFAPPVSSIETVLADDFQQMILVAEEQGPEGNPGVYAYHPDGMPFERNGTNRFGNNGEFDSDEEGMLLYSFPAHGGSDDGRGFIVVSDQRSDVTDFEFFDRLTWAHLGTVRLLGVSNTDGIASTQKALPGYPLGLFAAINNDTTTAVVGWDTLFTALGWDLSPEAVRIAPLTPGPTSAHEVAFSVQFSEPVTGFDASDDLVITHNGTTSTGASISGSGASYTVLLTGLTGEGTVALAIRSGGSVIDTTGNPLDASVGSPPVAIVTPYDDWAAASGLTIGDNDGETEDPDNDGCPNFKEFALNGNPMSGTESGKTRMRFEENDGTRYLGFTFPARNGAAFTLAGDGSLSASIDGIVYAVGGSVDLVAFDQGLVESIPASVAGLPALDEGWSYRTFRFSGSIEEERTGFLRVTTTPTSP